MFVSVFFHSGKPGTNQTKETRVQLIDKVREEEGATKNSLRRNESTLEGNSPGIKRLNKNSPVPYKQNEIASQDLSYSSGALDDSHVVHSPKMEEG